MLAQVKTKPLRGGPNGPGLTCPARAIRKVPRSGRRAGLQSNKELTNHLDTPNHHVSNPDCLRGDSLDCFAALAMTGMGRSAPQAPASSFAIARRSCQAS